LLAGIVMMSSILIRDLIIEYGKVARPT